METKINKPFNIAPTENSVNSITLRIKLKVILQNINYHL